MPQVQHLRKYNRVQLTDKPERKNAPANVFGALGAAHEQR
jgi:hypothetical protein